MCTIAMPHTTYVPRRELVKAVQTAITKLSTNLDKITYAITDELYPIRKDTPHFLLQFLCPDNRLERLLYSLVGRCAVQTEFMSAGGAWLCLNSLIGYSEFLLRHENLMLSAYQTVVEPYQIEREAYQNTVCNVCGAIGEEDLHVEVEKQCGEDKPLAVALWEAIKLAGLEGNIHVDDGVHAGYVVELKHGYSFKLRPFKTMLNATDKTWDKRNVKILVVDGLIERVSEIHNMLDGSMRSGMPMMIVAHGFSEEVVATIKANHIRGIFDIMPVRLGEDLESLNISNDVAVVCGTDIVSSLKGDMLMLKEYKDLPTVEHVRCTETEVTIVNAATRNAVGAQIKMLLNKKNEPHIVSDIADLYDRRIKSLLAHSVSLSLPNMSTAQKNTIKTKIDVCLRTVRSLVSYGHVNMDEVSRVYQPSELIGQGIKIAAKYASDKLFNKDIPTLTAWLGVTRACDVMMQVMTAAGAVKIDDEPT